MRPQVLMIAAASPSEAVLERFLRRFTELQADVWLASMKDVERTHAELDLAGLRSVRSRLIPTSPEFYRLADRVTPAEVAWQYISRDPWVQDRSDCADVLVAADANAVYSVWELARRNPHPAAVFGLEAGVAATERIVSGGSAAELRRRLGNVARVQRRRARKALRAAAEAGAATRVGEALAPLAKSHSGSVLVPRITRLEEIGRADRAAAVTAGLLTQRRTRRSRANLLGAVALRHLADGTAAPQLREAVEAELAYADELYARGNAPEAAASFWQATRLAFHRGFHLDTTQSPLADDPTGFTEPFRRSAVVQALRRSRGRLMPAPLPRPDAPKRVLLATANPHFLTDIGTRLENSDNFEVRSVTPADLGSTSRLARNPRMMIHSLMAGDGKAERYAEQGLRPHLDWADVVFVEWCTQLSKVFQLVDPGATRMIVRLHSYEAFTAWPLLLDTSRLDRLVFVSDHIRDLVLKQRPELAELETPVLVNGVDLRRLARPKSPDARFTVAMVGYKAVAKDVMWALDAVRRLRTLDPRYKLLLIGSDFDGFPSPAVARYRAEFQREAARLESAGGLERTGHLADVGTALVNAGTVLCSSVREGSPVGLLEATASGCVPVVRDWPFFAGDGRGARAMYPADWIVETPGEAAERLYRVTADPLTWQAESQRCIAEVLQHWDLSVVGANYDKLFGVSDTRSLPL